MIVVTPPGFWSGVTLRVYLLISILMKTKNYETPSVVEHELLCEGCLCQSLNDNGNESYGGLPGEEETIF